MDKNACPACSDSSDLSKIVRSLPFPDILISIMTAISSSITTTAALMLCFSLGACASESRPAHEPATAPSATTVKLSDCVPLSTLQNENHSAVFTDKLTPPLATETTYFGEIDEMNSDVQDKPTAALPIIAHHGGTEWTAMPLSGEGLTDGGWRYVGAGPRGKEISGAIDTAAGESRPSFVLVHSVDGGETFELTVFHKPCKLAEFFDFTMSRDGHGQATLSLDSDCGPHKAGLYHFETTDDGKTWSTDARYEPDAMIRADNVEDDEQPDAPADDSKKTMSQLRSGPNDMKRLSGLKAFATGRAPVLRVDARR